MNARIWFDPARLPERDQDGYTQHPDLDDLFEDCEPGDELIIDMEKLRVAGFAAEFLLMQHDLQDDHAAYIEYFVNGGGANDWAPEPAEPQWQLVAIYDTEDGPAAMFVCPRGNGGAI